MHHWDISGFSLSLSLSRSLAWLSARDFISAEFVAQWDQVDKYHNRRTIAENHAEKNASIKAPIEDDGMADFGMAAKVANFGTSA